MKLICVLLVLLAMFEFSQSNHVNGRSHRRSPFPKRPRAIQTPSNIAPGIVGGRPADIADFPWHLGLLDLSWGGYICGASNISPFWALSAAHCLEFDTPATLINLWGGSTSRLTGGHLFFVTEYILHPQYDDWSLDNDIAVIQVDPNTPLSGHPNVSPISLPDNCLLDCCGVCIEGPPITVAGWGADNSGSLPVNLLQIDKDIFDHDECDRLWVGWGGVTGSMFCTNVENGIDSCGGDSGSAIIRNGIQVGLVSFGSEVCGDGTLPAVYVRNEYPIVRNFIRQHAGV